MGLFDDIGDLVDDAADVVSDVGSDIGDAAEAVGSAAADAAGSAGGYVGDAVGAIGGAVDAATFGGASAALNLVDDTVFDGVDYVTGGVVDIDFDDGKFSASVGIDGVADVGASIGEHGLTVSSDSLIASTDVGLTDTGFSLDTTGGVNFGPLPYYDGHVDVSPTGDVSINGHVQGTVPTPYGLLSGEASGGFVKTDDGWGAYVNGDGTLTLPSGTMIGGELQAGYLQHGDDSQTTLGIGGSITEPGVGTLGGSVGYERTEHDGIVITQEHGEAHASGFGMSASASESYTGLDTPQGSLSQWTSDVDIKGLDAGSLAQLGQSLLGADDSDLAGALGSLAANGSLPDLIGNLDPGTTSALVARVADFGSPGSGEAAPATPGAPAMSLDDDVLGGTTAAAAPGPAASDFGATGDAGAYPGFETGAPGGDDEWASPPASGEPAGVAAPDPVDALGQSVAAADQIDQDTSSMFDDLGS